MLALASPLLLPAIRGFLASPRNDLQTVGSASEHAVPWLVFVTSFFGGYFGVLGWAMLKVYALQSLQAFPSCAASLLLLNSLRRNKIGGGNKPVALPKFDLAIGIMALVTVVFVVRPNWLGILLHQIPFFRSLRWPFREILQYLFFVHVWIALRCGACQSRGARLSAVAGTAIFAASLLLVAPWSFAPMRLDRELILSGQADGYWRRVKKSLGPQDQIIAVMDPKLTFANFSEIPYSLIGAYNYPSLFRVRGASGYLAAGLAPTNVGGAAPFHWGGIYSPDAGARLLARNPNLRALQLVSLHPMRIELRSAKSRQKMILPPLLTAKSGGF